jgi:hypothetical protein
MILSVRELARERKRQEFNEEINPTYDDFNFFQGYFFQGYWKAQSAIREYKQQANKFKRKVYFMKKELQGARLICSGLRRHLREVVGRGNHVLDRPTSV